MSKRERIKPLQGKLVVLAAMIVGLWIATEFTACALRFSPHLGDTLFELNHVMHYGLVLSGVTILLVLIYATYQWKYKIVSAVLLGISILCLTIALIPIYNPFAFIIWLFEFGDVVPSWIWYIGILIIGICSLLSVLLYLRIVQHRPTVVSNIHGSAQFATPEEVERTGLLDQDSPYAIYVGAWQTAKKQPIRYLRYTGESNVAVFAPPRSGKGAGIIILNLLSYLGNAVILDLKLENYHHTAGYRKSIGQSIFKLDFTCTDDSSACLNPLLEVRQGIHEVRDVQNIVDMIADPDGKGRSDHWTDTANDLLVSIVLHMLYVEADKSLTGVRSFISNLHMKEEELFTYMLNTVHDPEGVYGWIDPHTGKSTRTHPIVAAGARDMLNRSEAERTGITSTLKRFLKLYRDPIIAKNSRRSDFKISDLLDPNKSITLYINMPPSDKNRLRPLIRLVFHQLLTRLTETWIPLNERKEQRAPLLLIMDEFPQLGRLQFFESALAYTAGYGMRTLLIAQDLSQIYSEYGQHQSITASCDITTIYAPNKLETAQYFSNMLGHQTITQEQTNYSGHRSSTILSHVNTSDHNYKRSLLTPDELMRMPSDQSIIFKTGHNSIEGKKVMYWNDPVFNDRAKIPPPERSDQVIVSHDWNYIQLNRSEKKIKEVESVDDILSTTENDSFDLL